MDDLTTDRAQRFGATAAVVRARAESAARRPLAVALKRAIDIVGALVGIIVLSPLFVAVGLAILLVDGRPIFFRQERVGLRDHSFTLLKFRTMVPDAEARRPELDDRNEIRGPGFKITEDPRLTRTGRFLRRSSLDELPQLWNVLRGEMSLVGPRPALRSEVASYEGWHRRRLAVRPGITGLWQITARRDCDFDLWVRLDLAYIEQWSPWLDLRILARTVLVVLAFGGR